MTDTRVTPLRRRRTYLDACREQGIYQETEEARAGLAEIEARRARMRRKETASLAAFHAGALVPYTDGAPGRLHEFLNAFEAVTGDGLVNLLRHLLLNTDIPASQAEAILRAALDASQKENPSHVE